MRMWSGVSYGNVISGGQPGDQYIKDWGASGEHVMTIVGYDDDVNCGDDGMGAFKVANSWGQGWKNQGFIWLPYSLAQANLLVKIIDVVEYRQTSVIAKIKMRHEARNRIKLGVFISDDPNSIAPPTVIGYHKWFEAMRIKGGGELYLNGVDNNPLTFGYDISDYIDDNFSSQDFPQLKIIIAIDEDDEGDEFDGEVLEFSILDYREDPNNPFEVYCHNENIPIVNDGITNLTIDYFVLPSVIDESRSLDFNCIVRDDVVISNPFTLTYSGQYLDFYDNGNLIVQDGANLQLQPNVQIHVQRTAGQISAFGNMTWGDYISVHYRQPEYQFTTFIENPNLNLTIDNCSYQGNIDVLEIEKLTLLNSSFNYSDIVHKYGDIELQGNTLYNSSLGALDPFNDYKRVDILNGNVFALNTNDLAAIYIEGFRNFIIDGNIIEYYGNGSGIYLFDAGSSTGDKMISHSVIRYCGGSGDHAGIRALNSNITIFRNDEINDNSYGIQLYDHTNSMINGDKLADNVYETQYIHDNVNNQIRATCQSLPWYCHWNAIVDEDNTDQLFDTENRCSYIDVRWNYWGENFDPETDLVWGCDFEPIWNISPGTRMVYEDEQLYDSACILADNGNYVGSKETLDNLINNFPDSTLASIAIKELYWLEKESTHNYDSLIYYYQNNSIIQNDSLLKETANYMIALSEREAEQYDTAIVRFEEIILDPPSFEDSIFAIIDLAYTYQQMPDSSLRSSVGTLSQYRFPSYNLFIESREYHLGLLHSFNTIGNGNELPVESGIANKDVSVYPNPFRLSVTFSYSLEKPSIIILEIFNSQGQLLKFHRLEQDEGKKEVIWNAKALPPGIYYFKIQADGIVSSGKLILMR